MSLTNRIEKLETRLQTSAALNREIEMLMAELRTLGGEDEIEQYIAEVEARLASHTPDGDAQTSGAGRTRQLKRARIRAGHAG